MPIGGFNATPMTTQSISMNVGKRISPGNLARFDAFERRKVFSQMFYISKFFQLSWKHRYYIQSGGSGTFDRDKIEARLKERSVLPRRNRSFGKKKGRFSWNLDLLSLRFESELWRDPLRDKFFVFAEAPEHLFSFSIYVGPEDELVLMALGGLCYATFLFIFS